MAEARRKRQRETPALTWSMMGRISTSERNARVRAIWLDHVRYVSRTYEGTMWIARQYQAHCRSESGHFRIDGTRIGSEG